MIDASFTADRTFRLSFTNQGFLQQRLSKSPDDLTYSDNEEDVILQSASCTGKSDDSQSSDSGVIFRIKPRCDIKELLKRKKIQKTEACNSQTH